MVKHRYLSRSGLVAWQRCPRLGYLSTVYGGLGIMPVGKDASLAIGSSDHAGVETLLRGLKDGRVDVDAAVVAALGTYEEETASGLAGIPERFQARVRREHSALITASVKLYAAVRVPTIDEKYEVVEVETEHTIRLTPWLTLLSRPDAVFAQRFSGWYDVFSLKTAGKYDRRKQTDPTVDMQGLSETFAVQHDYPGALVDSVMMEYIIVGKEDDEDPEDGTDELYPIRRSPLVRGWMRTIPGEIGTPARYELAWRYKYPNPNFDPAKPRKAGNFRQTSLSAKQGWAPVVAFDVPGGVDAWVAALRSGQMIPRAQDVAEEIFQFPPTYVRRQEHIDAWLESTIYEQTRHSVALEAYESGELTLDQAFPKYTHSCTYPKRCPMYDVCWKGASPDDATQYIPRVPHHEQESLEPPNDGE